MSKLARDNASSNGQTEAPPEPYSQALPPDILAARLHAFKAELQSDLSELLIGVIRGELQRAVQRSPAPEPLLSVSDVATWLNVSNRTVEKLVARGKILPIRVAGQRRFTRTGVEAYLKSAEGKRGRITRQGTRT